MEIRQAKPYFVIFGLLTAAAAALLWLGEARPAAESDPFGALPDALAGFRGEDIWYCRNSQCPVAGRGFADTDRGSGGRCPRCGGRMDTVSLSERIAFLGDTRVLRKRYAHADGRAYTVSVVFGGREQANIHRPQMCLRGQGRDILRERVLKVPLPERSALAVAVLDLQWRPPAGQKETRRFAGFAYWFAAGKRETASNAQRMIWTASDNLLRGVTPRWAYVSVITDWRDTPADTAPELAAFIAALYPTLHPSG